MAASYAVPFRQVSVLPSVPSGHFLTDNALSVQLTVPPVGPVEDFRFSESDESDTSK